MPPTFLSIKKPHKCCWGCWKNNHNNFTVKWQLRIELSSEFLGCRLSLLAVAGVTTLSNTVVVWRIVGAFGEFLSCQHSLLLSLQISFYVFPFSFFIFLLLRFVTTYFTQFHYAHAHTHSNATPLFYTLLYFWFYVLLCCCYCCYRCLHVCVGHFHYAQPKLIYFLYMCVWYIHAYHSMYYMLCNIYVFWAYSCQPYCHPLASYIQ